jgi:hypothetical protein
MIDVDGEEIPTNLKKILERRAVCLFLLCPTGAFFLDTSSPSYCFSSSYVTPMCLRHALYNSADNISQLVLTSAIWVALKVNEVPFIYDPDAEPHTGRTTKT